MDQDGSESERQSCEAWPEPESVEPPRGGAALSGQSLVVWGLLLGLALLVRLDGLTGAGLWHDEVMSIHVARMDLSDVLLTQSLADHHPPLYFLLLKAWSLGSWSVTWLRLFSVIASTAGVIFAVLWMRRIDDRAGWLTGLLVAVSPVLVHYGQEIRAYGLLYTLVLAGLYFGERLAVRPTPAARCGWLATCTLATWTHYLGLLATPALLVYAWLRGASLRQLLRLSGVWLLMAVPVVALAVLNAEHRSTAGFWVPPLTIERVGSLVGSWLAIGTAQLGQHASLETWQATDGGAVQAWAAFGLRTLIFTAVGSGLLLGGLPSLRAARSPARALLAMVLVYAGLIAGVSLAVTSLALTRATIITALPLLGLLGLAGARSHRRWYAGLGTACCVAVACAWLIVNQAVPPNDPGRRPKEPVAFAPIAAQWEPGDVLAVFSPELQASAGYFLADWATADQIHTTEQPNLLDTPAGLRLKPGRRQSDPDWFERVTQAVRRNAQTHPTEHAVWVLDLGPRSIGDPQRRSLLAWLKDGYVRDASYQVDGRWTFAVRRYVPAASGPAD